MTRETAVLFGRDRQLVGVWTEAQDASAVAEAPAVIMINSGLVPHTGVGRLHVRLARALAQRGIPSLRFDLSGIGDSGSVREIQPLQEIVRQDVDAAIAYTRQVRGIERVVTIGLCSGARDALDAAGRHQNVVGLVAVDLIVDLKTWQFHAVHFGQRLLRFASWKNTLFGRNGRLQALFRRTAAAASAPADDDDGLLAVSGIRPRLARTDLRDRLSPLLERGTRLLLLFSGGLEDNYNHRRQFRTAIPDLVRAQGLGVDYFPDANHTFEQDAQQRALIARVTEWCSQGFARRGT